MLVLSQATHHQLSILLEQPKRSEISGFQLPESEEIAPRFLLEFLVEQLSQDPDNRFWWSPRLIVVNRFIVGMGGFKAPPDAAGSVEIGYGIVPSQQGCGFATQAVDLLIKEGFSKPAVQTINAHTTPENVASWRVLEKNNFVKIGSKLDPEDGEVWIWQRPR